MPDQKSSRRRSATAEAAGQPPAADAAAQAQQAVQMSLDRRDNGGESGLPGQRAA